MVNTPFSDPHCPIVEGVAIHRAIPTRIETFHDKGDHWQHLCIDLQWPFPKWSPSLQCKDSDLVLVCTTQESNEGWLICPLYLLITLVFALLNSKMCIHVCNERFCAVQSYYNIALCNCWQNIVADIVWSYCKSSSSWMLIAQLYLVMHLFGSSCIRFDPIIYSGFPFICHLPVCKQHDKT